MTESTMIVVFQFQQVFAVCAEDAGTLNQQPIETRQKESLWPAVIFRRNTQAIVSLASEKSRQARLRVIEAIAEMQREGTPINFNAIGRSCFEDLPL
jgi:hypothetical protein